MNRGVTAVAVGLVGIGAILMVVATFLPLNEATGLFRLVQQNTLIQHDGWLAIVVAVAIAAGAIFAAFNDKGWELPGGLSIVAAIGLSLLASNTAVRTLYPVGSDGVADSSKPGEVAPWGIAIYVLGVGIALALVGSLIGRLGGGIGLGGGAKKKCPDCAESILADAQVCKHCGYRFGKVARRAPATTVAKKAPSAPETAKRTVVCPLCDAEQRIPATAVRFTCGRCTEISPVPA